MFDYLKRILLGAEPPAHQEGDHTEGNKDQKVNRLQLATCALFVEMAKADDHFSEQERESIIKHMKQKFNLEDEAVTELIELSEKKAEQSVSIYEFTSVINEYFSREEKFELLKNLWHLIFLDKKLSAYEDQLIKKIGATLNIEHRDIISAKLLVKEEINSVNNKS
ncbi:MAG: hypothetical protein Kow0098_07650 [Ignavibacteriaceae bacterium]